MGDRLGIPGAVGFKFVFKDISLLREGNTPFERAGWRGFFWNCEILTILNVRRLLSLFSKALATVSPCIEVPPHPLCFIWSAVSPRFPFHAAVRFACVFRFTQAWPAHAAINGAGPGCPLSTTIPRWVHTSSRPITGQLSNVGPG